MSSWVWLFQTWLGLVISVVSFLIACYQLKQDNHSKAAKFFFGTTVLILLAMWWFHYRDSTHKEATQSPTAVPQDRPAPRNPASAKFDQLVDISPTHKPLEETWTKVMRDPAYVDALESPDIRLKALNMWVEGVEITPKNTVVHVAVRGWAGYGTTNLRPASGAYIVDDQGRDYSLDKERRIGAESFRLHGEVRPEGVIERFDLFFVPPMRQPTEFIRLKHPQFPAIKVNKSSVPAVYFCNPSAWDAASTSEILCDRNQGIELAKGQFTVLELRPGHHSCGLRNGEPPIDINLVGGYQYYFQIRDPFWTKGSMNLLSDQEGTDRDSKLISQCLKQ